MRGRIDQTISAAANSSAAPSKPMSSMALPVLTRPSDEKVRTPSQADAPAGARASTTKATTRTIAGRWCDAVGKIHDAATMLAGLDASFREDNENH